ncbi:MAG: hypothetical protein WA584_19520 [Pyrinomonadaceae bacterium]
MKRFTRTNFLLCGIALMLAAFPVFAQKNDDAAQKIEINRQPLKDFARVIQDKIEKKETDFDKPFLVEMEGTITADGRFDTKTSKFTRTEGDAQMVELGKMAIQAIGEAGFFGYLKNFGIDKVLFSMQQDDGNFLAVIKSELKTPERAKTTASGLNTMLSVIKVADREGIKKIDEASKALINNLKVSTQEKSVIIDFSMPKADFHELLMREIMKSKDKNKNVQS